MQTRPSPAATLAAGMSRLGRPPQLQPSPLMAQEPQQQPQAEAAQARPLLAQPTPHYGGGKPNIAGYAPQAIQSVLASLAQRTRNPQTSNLAALYQRFFGNQGVL
jgi:hypothetical protein